MNRNLFFGCCCCCFSRILSLQNIRCRLNIRIGCTTISKREKWNVKYKFEFNMILYFASFYPSNGSDWFALTLLAMVCCRSRHRRLLLLLLLLLFLSSSYFLPSAGSSALICVEEAETNEKQTPYLSLYNISVWIINKHSCKIRMKMCTNNTHRRFWRFHSVSLHQLFQRAEALH